MRWPEPRENQNPWYPQFVTFSGAIDASVYASKEDASTIGIGGGTFTFDATSGVITWSTTISLLSAYVGFLWQLIPGQISLDDGQIFYVELPRAPTDQTTVPPLKASNLSTASRDSSFVLAVRVGNKVYWRNGAVMGDGDSFQVFEATGGQGGGGGGSGIGTAGQKIRNVITVATGETTDQSSFTVKGDYALDPDDYEITGTSVEIRLVGVGSITNSATTGNIQLFNLTDSAIVTTLNFNGGGDTAPVKKTSGALALASGLKMYEIRVRVTGGTPPADKLLATWVGFQVDNIFLDGGT
jgi:hypothetical protein